MFVRAPFDCDKSCGKTSVMQEILDLETNASFKNDPKAYITTVGLYNDTNELLAVAKLSKPILKSFSREAIIKVKLDY